MNLLDYRSIVFDCDGVILNSNRVKTDAFYNAALPYGEAAATAMVDYHVRNGGISRYRKFEHFLQNIVPVDMPGPGLQDLLEAYAEKVKVGLLACEIAEGLEAFRHHTSGARWLVASGGDQAELRELFEARGLLDWFDGGIFGSPDAKEEIVKRELENGNIRKPALFIGDSRYDHQVAHKNGLDFVFVTRWSEFERWEDYFAPYDITIKTAIKDLFI
ncbi:HAD family hydrolase [Stutzerimonas stutzeri]|uniref:HAD family hydrolase n=1 Tax=Stutzerimonas stutzeri TaxID=316 RepID=UPI001CFCB1F2|nr:HAD family hydrolase [Stutzerimonas stutzeri]